MSSTTLDLLAGRRGIQPYGTNHGFSSSLKEVIPFVFLTLGLLATKPALLRVIFPAAVCAFGYRIYKRNECYYLSFALWICMLTPLLRRVVDWKTSYQMQSLILLAPLLVTLLPLIDLRHRLARVPPMIRTSTLLTLSGVIFGAGIGLIKHPGSTVILSTLMWIGPMVLCVFAASIRDKEMLGRVLTRTLAWGVLVMALYGIYQFVVAPAWDTYWLVEVNRDSFSPSFGHPEPFGIRVWSTMNSPGSFALFLGAALIWLATRSGPVVAIANMTGYVALCLSLVRTAWIMTVLGLLIYLVTCRKMPSLKTAASTLVTLGLISCGLLYVMQFHGVKERFETFSSLKSDRSVQERRLMYQFMEQYISSTPLGDGLQSPVEYHGYLLDSTFAELFFMLGWIGGLLYAAGLGYLLLQMTVSLRRATGLRAAAIAVTLACASQAVSGDVLYRQGGVVLWLFVGVWASASVRNLSPPSRSETAFASP